MVSKNDIKVNILEIDNHIIFQAFAVISTQKVINKEEEFTINYDSIINIIKDDMCSQLNNIQCFKR